MADRLQRSSADSAQLLHAANELSQREARLCARRDAVSELEAALAVTLTQRNILCSSLVSDEFFDALDAAHAVCRLDHCLPTTFSNEYFSSSHSCSPIAFAGVAPPFYLQHTAVQCRRRCKIVEP
jgi:hypothetical protein